MAIIYLDFDTLQNKIILSSKMTEALKKTWLYKSYLNDPSFLGNLTPEYLSNGPLEERHCTDLLCYLLFIACWIGSIFVAMYSFAHGDPQLAFRPADPSSKKKTLNPPDNHS